MEREVRTVKEKSENGFFQAVYAVVKSVPKGKVITYGEVATLTGYPRRARYVGYALHCNPDPENIPCHRVVNRFGEVAPAFVFGGPDEQRKRLEKEGVVFGDDGKIDLSVYGMGERE